MTDRASGDFSAYLDGRVRLHPGDCLDRLRLIPDASVDAIVTDPPYALTSIVNRFGKEGAAPAQFGTDGAFTRASRGFMGKAWDAGERAFAVEFWRECYRVLKPGGHVVAFSGTRTYHHLAVAIEGAGFEVRDQLAWVYGTGFPKSHNVAKAIDKAAGVVREVVGQELLSNDIRGGALLDAAHGTVRPALVRDVTIATSDEAKTWEGWGSALKPAWEPICLARKPLDGTIAENVLAHGVGALNIDGCRVGETGARNNGRQAGTNGIYGEIGATERVDYQKGRFPSNLVHDGSPEVLAAFPQAPGQQQDVMPDAPSAKTGNVYGKMNRPGEKSADVRYADRGSTNFAALPGARRGDTGSAARFFYTAKADGDDRHGFGHPTIKPVDLMRWCIRLVCRKGGTVLDPFAGTGTTGEAAYWEGCNAILVEREEEYQAMIARRMSLVLAGPDEKKRARTKLAPAEGLPLFGNDDDKMQTSGR